MINPLYWKKRYVIQTDADRIEKTIKLETFLSGEEKFDLVSFKRNEGTPNILISPGSGGHSFVFAELGYQMYTRGYNVFIMPKHGGVTINELIHRHENALRYINTTYNNSTGVFAEGLGGYACFYLALANDSIMKSAAYMNAPVIMTEKTFMQAWKQGDGTAKRRKRIFPFVKLISKIFPKLKLPIRFYLDFKQMIDTEENNWRIEMPLVESFSEDPDFDKRYPLSAIVSLVNTDPPKAVSDLKVSTLFLVPSRGFFPSYEKDLYKRLPDIRKSLIEVDGSVFWMLSHPYEAAKIICEWFDSTIPFKPSNN
jgi:hypothetical protein